MEVFSGAVSVELGGRTKRVNLSVFNTNGAGHRITLTPQESAQLANMLMSAASDAGLNMVEKPFPKLSGKVATMKPKKKK